MNLKLLLTEQGRGQRGREFKESENDTWGLQKSTRNSSTFSMEKNLQKNVSKQEKKAGHTGDELHSSLGMTRQTPEPGKQGLSFALWCSDCVVPKGRALKLHQFLKCYGLWHSK